MDHEYGSASLEPSLVGWDWFSLQLEDNTELTIYLLRQLDGVNHQASSGTYVDAGGYSHHLPGRLSPWRSSIAGSVPNPGLATRTDGASKSPDTV